jgi:uncharacterized protein (TIGR02301 family)
MRHMPALISSYALPAMKRSILAALAAVSMLCVAPAFAQQGEPDTLQGEQNLSGEQWYRQQLIDLSEVLGGSHYLRIVCEGRGDQRWRDYMRGVIQRAPQYNDVLVEGFNRGYRDQEARFPVCDDTTRQMEAELRARGLRISQALGAHHAEE